MNRLRDSRLGRAWMAIREDETAADCTGVNPISTKLLAFALGASFSGFAGSVYAAKLQAITPGAFEFQVSIMLLCMVVLGGAGSLKGVILGGMLITLFDRVVLTQSTFMVRAVGRTLGIACARRHRPHPVALVLLRPRARPRHAAATPRDSPAAGCARTPRRRCRYRRPGVTAEPAPARPGRGASPAGCAMARAAAGPAMTSPARPRGARASPSASAESSRSTRSTWWSREAPSSG